MKAISINAYEIENDDGETLVFMTPKEFDFIKKQNELKDKEIERLNKENNDLQNIANIEISKSEFLEKEIERLNNIIKGLDNTIENLDEVVEKKRNIIKEVRECINRYAIENEDYSKIYNDEEKELLEILDKVSNNESN